MKFKYFLFLALFISLLSGISLSGAENLLRNGDFSEGSGSGETRSFGQTAGWYNWGSGDQNAVARRVSAELGSEFVAQVNDRYDVVNAQSDFQRDAFGPTTHVQRTEYMIQPGDMFRIQFDWVDSHGWNRAWDEIRFVLFATDTNTLAGEVVWTSIHDSGILFQSGVPQAFEAYSDSATGDTVGRELFVAFFGFQNNHQLSSNTGFARVGNLKVTLER